MITIREYVTPSTLEEAYDILINRKNNIILGGCSFLKLGSKSVGVGIDLKNINLSYIKETEEEILIGADTTLRELETNNLTREYANGVIKSALSEIVGAQFRNNARIGASIYSKYGFSDILPTLLVLGTKVRLHKQGILELQEFLNQKYQKDILVELILPKQDLTAVFESIRKCSGDFAVLNSAMSVDKYGKYLISIGARPQRASICKNACEILNYKKDINKAAQVACEELSFGTNIRGSKEYRQDICKALIIRMYERLGGEANDK